MLLEFLSNLWFVDWWCLGWLDAMKVSHQLFYWHFTRYCLCLLLDTLVSCQFLSKSTVVLITIVALFIQLSTIIYWEYVGLYGKKWGCCETASSVVHGRTPLLYSTKVSFPFSSSPPPHPPILHVCERCLLCVVCVLTRSHMSQEWLLPIFFYYYHVLRPDPLYTRRTHNLINLRCTCTYQFDHQVCWNLMQQDIQTHMIWKVCYMDRVSYTFSGSVPSCFSCFL